MAKRTFNLLGHVRSAHELDLNALLRYCSSNIPAFPPFPSNFRVSQVLLLPPPPFCFLILLIESVYCIGVD